MLSSTVGYTGGDEPEPTYASVCRRANTHTEAVRLVFDPALLSFEELMRTYAADPRLKGYEKAAAGGGYAPAQQKKAVWAQSERQAAVARRVLASVGKPVPVLPATTWWEAEDYHQQHIAEDKSYPDEGDDDPWGDADGPGTAWGL